MNRKINLKSFTGFALTKNDSSLEAQRLSAYCTTHDVPLFRVDKNVPCPSVLVPCGSVEWCLQSLGKKIIPDYYPFWLEPFFHRNIWKESKWPLKKVFIKPADAYKRFTGFSTTGTYKKKKKPPFWCSDIIHFDNEWRYYITDGQVMCAGWYWGDEVNTPAPPDLKTFSPMFIPPDFCGTLDFGDYNGLFTLVEAHHPFACGWYGPQADDHLYLQWLVDGWEYLQDMYNPGPEPRRKRRVRM